VADTIIIEVHYTTDCTSWQRTAQMLAQAANELSLSVMISSRPVASDREAMELGFIGSPTVLINDVDPWPMPDAPAGLRLRPYFGAEGMLDAPSYEMIRSALQAADAE
jgi:hypothetical protein